jgi:uncharacterized repeat protein (TIGR01451 family)
VNIRIEIRDDDPGGDPDDIARLKPSGGEALNLVFDRNTGQVSGDVNAPQGTGCSSGIPPSGLITGHPVEICFEISSLPDSDNDGLFDVWEACGIDSDGDGDVDINLPAMGASARRKDIFVEVDCMVNDANNNGSLADPVDHSHCPLAAAIGDVVQAFANAHAVFFPLALQNLDGTSGIQLHVDVGSLYGANNVTTVPRTAPTPGGGAVGNYGDFGGGGSQIPEAGNTIIDWDGAAGNPGTNFYSLKGPPPGNFFNATRAHIFRYMIFGHQTNARRATNDCTSGWAEGSPGNDFFVTLGGTNPAGGPCWATDANGFSVGSRAQQAGTFMHELGHTLGLQHGGGDDINAKPNYLSVMNYNWQPCSVPKSAVGGVPGGCDYSRIGPTSPIGGMVNLFETFPTGLDECVGIGGGLGFGAVNWNGNALLEGATCPPPNTANITADVNNDGVCIRPGTNGIIDTAPGGDDAPNYDGDLADGPNRVCQTIVPMGDDVQVTAAGATGQTFATGVASPQPSQLLSFTDWGNIVYVFQTLANFADGVASPVPDEPDPDTIAHAQAYLSTLSEPILVIVDTAPATILPGQTLTWTIEISNIGHGPALEASLVDTLPDGSQVPFALDTVIVGATVTHTAQLVVPADACLQKHGNKAHLQNLVHQVQVSYKDLAGKDYAADASATTRVLCGSDR